MPVVSYSPRELFDLRFQRCHLLTIVDGWRSGLPESAVGRTE
jgi:hypothetical protein